MLGTMSVLTPAPVFTSEMLSQLQAAAAAALSFWTTRSMAPLAGAVKVKDTCRQVGASPW